MKLEILQLATRQMREGGYDALNFRGIAETLGISKANIHHHFTNKETLALEVITSYTEEMLDGVRVMAGECGADLERFIASAEGFFWAICRESGHCSVCVCEQVAYDVDAPESMKALSRAFSGEFYGIVHGVVRACAEEGRLRPGLDVETATTQICMMMFGLGTMARTKSTVIEAERALGGIIQRWVKTLMV